MSILRIPHISAADKGAWAQGEEGVLEEWAPGDEVSGGDVVFLKWPYGRARARGPWMKSVQNQEPFEISIFGAKNKIWEEFSSPCGRIWP